MSQANQQEIVDLVRSPGELSFEARIGGLSKRIWFRAETEVTPSAEAALAACLVPAMRGGGTLTMSEPVSPRLLRNQREFQTLQWIWSEDWEFEDPPLDEVEVRAAPRDPAPREPTGRVAAFFSGGVDSWATIVDNPDLTDLIFVRGVDLLPRLHQSEFADEVEARLREAAEQLGLGFHAVATNVRELADPLVPWETYFACPLAATALFFEPLFDRVLIASDTDYAAQQRLGGAWTMNSLWSTERLELVDACGRYDRIERTRQIAAHPLAQSSLRVCWENPGGAYNCGRCRKCLITMATLEMIGALGSFRTFPELDPELLGRLEISHSLALHFWEDLLLELRQSNRQDLADPIEESTARSRTALGLSPDHRLRPRPIATTRPRRLDPPAPTLLATPATAEALANASAAAFLVGGYDGSGNFGDIAQLGTALDLLAPFEPGLLVLPVIEQACEADHERLVGQMRNPPAHVLRFGTAGDGTDLVELIRSPGLAYAACYLYGGGYFNPNWGDRKLAMLSAAETLAGPAARVDRLASGLQVDPGWLAGLAGADQRTLCSFSLLGGRDPRSTEALATLGPARNCGDDAIGLLADEVDAVAAGPAAGPLRVNLHFAEHGWVTDDPEAMLRFHTGFLAELSRLAARPLQVQPLLTYVDQRTDERPALARLGAACAGAGIELLEPLLLRPADYAASAAEMRRAALTLCCSYHAALASLMLGVPAVLLEDNSYYEQKAAGLRADFGVPADLRARSGEDPAAAAARILAATEGEPGAELRRQLAAAAAAAAARRARTEVRIASIVGAGASAVLANGGGEAAARRRLAAATERAEAAEHSAQEAHRQLASVLRSRTWRLAEPLRRAARAVRARR